MDRMKAYRVEIVMKKEKEKMFQAIIHKSKF